MIPPSVEHLIAADLRLAALRSYGILDTPPEEAFDGIVRLATRLCLTPVGLVSFVAADRQWFKARIGFPSCETDLDRSVCKFALAEPDLLVVPDLAADLRTAANPLVTGEPFIRFYAGAPLRMPDGQVLGSLCVIDTVPRPAGLSPEQRDDLRTLADQVVTQLLMRRAVADRDQVVAFQAAELRRAHRLDVVAAASSALLTAEDPSAVLEPILRDGAEALGFDRACLYDVSPDGGHLRLTHSVNVAPEAREYIRRLPFGTPLCGIVAETGEPLILEGLQSGNDPRWDVARGHGLDAYAGFPVKSRGEVRAVIAFVSTRMPAFDGETLAFFETLARLMAAVHERLDGEDTLAETAAYWRSLFERLSEGFIVGEVVREAGRVVDWRYVEVNRAWGELVGMDVRQVVGRTIREILPGIEDAWVDEFAQVVETGEPREFLRRVATLDRWYEGRAFAIGADRFAVTFLEVTDRVQADARRMALLALGDRLRDLTAIPEMIHAAAEIVGTTLGSTRAGFGYVDAAMEFIDVQADWTAPGVPSIAGRHRFSDFGDLRADLRRGEALVIEDVRTDARTRSAPRSMLELGVGSLVNMPVRDRGRVVAVFIVQDDKPHHWSAETLAFIRNVAERVEAGVARVKAEQEQHVLNEEISHRLKNMLAMVLSIATQTLRGVPDRAPVEAFERRIHALSTAHNVLLHKTWTAAPMREVATAVLGAAGHADRVAVSGPDLDLGPRATLSVSLLLHELATNAAKYGGLSVPEGGVTVTWRLDDGPEGREVVLDWVERGGPPPVAPAQSRRAGFGSRLIRMGLAGSGGVDLRYPSSGFEATMRAPLVQLQHG
ncbi:GAF domain-containing protein [Methylorubrum thiocyanatum]|uniref:histidine kinase n=1 Tax=Methylorubrum thiocyanatum TaxID=47958 RepID=A0AA40S609_9HYPH|nr:GAF domain-containing protein [Methylorubrum thiocyanatum]MBA8915126.1 PAS domain S-box-containing protein [Methylorubrum thiocyanatum]